MFWEARFFIHIYSILDYNIRNRFYVILVVFLPLKQGLDINNIIRYFSGSVLHIFKNDLYQRHLAVLNTG